MSTRATYQFLGHEFKPDITVYIHHDGYPAGAAEYFQNATNTGGIVTVEAFLRANERAQITDSHHGHADTEYRYDVSPSGAMTAWERRRVSCECLGDEQWVDFFQGPVSEFIADYLNT